MGSLAPPLTLKALNYHSNMMAGLLLWVGPVGPWYVVATCACSCTHKMMHVASKSWVGNKLPVWTAQRQTIMMLWRAWFHPSMATMSQILLGAAIVDFIIAMSEGESIQRCAAQGTTQARCSRLCHCCVRRACSHRP